MGVLNVTPDSFYDGGRHGSVDDAVRHGLAMYDAGATIIDVGPESTRPGAAPVDSKEQIRRAVPVLQRLAEGCDALLSIDTSDPEVMRAAVAAGAGMINDVRALRQPGALETAAELAVPVCLMHMRGEPDTMQEKPRYEDVLAEVDAFFSDRIEACLAAGIKRNHLLLDPGIGFGKTLQHNLTLLAGLGTFKRHQLPLLIGVSRKSLFDQLLGRAVEDRLAATLAAAMVAIRNGADILRVHDVRAHADLLAVWLATEAAGVVAS